MDTENLFISAAAVVVLGICFTIGSINSGDNDAMNAMIKQGANPIAARCAVKGITSQNREACKAAIK